MAYRSAGILLLAAAMAAAILASVLAQTTGAAPTGNPDLSDQLQNPKVTISYEPVKETGLYQHVYDQLHGRHVLEDIRSFLAFLNLPKPLALRLTECGVTNSWYEPQKATVSLCYEFVDWIERVAPMRPAAGGLTQQDAVVGPFVQVVFHELGHALFDILQVPVMGREEDAADAFSAYIMLLAGKDMAHRTLPGAAYFWAATAATPWGRSTFSDEHGEPLQRSYNLLCMAYGGYPDEFQYLVDAGLLPKSRADLCGHDYKLLATAVAKTIAPHINQDGLKAVQARQWLRPKDGILQ